MDNYEKLGAFYLGRAYDLAEKKGREGELTLYDSKDLVTHAVCVGMTGSGKTGLCIGLLEEAAIDGIPAIVIDPKGDLPNLLLTFPELGAADFTPWVNEDDARKKGLSVDEYGGQQAELWKKGLAGWGQSGERIRRLRESADFAVYTPLRKRNWLGAVAASNVVGLIADSVIFLWLAFDSLQYLPGQVVGKTWMTLLAVAVLWLLRRRLAPTPGR